MAKGMVIKAWLDAVPTNIARSERAHGAMRVDLRSVGQGRALAPSSNRMLCRELKAAHVEKGGVDPAPALSTMAIGDEAKLGAGRAAKLNGAHPGNPWLRYLNMKMHSYKVYQGSGRALTDDEIKSVRAAALEDWHTIRENNSQHSGWKDFSRNQSTLKANRVQAIADKGAQRAFEGVWSSSSSAMFMLDPDDVANGLAEFDKGMSKLDKVRRAWQDATLPSGYPR